MQKEKERSVLDKSFLHPLQKIRLLWEQIHKIELKEKNIMKRTPIVLISVFAAAIQLLSASEEVKLSTKRLDVTIKENVGVAERGDIQYAGRSGNIDRSDKFQERSPLLGRNGDVS